jgi:hypothetical protein
VEEESLFVEISGYRRWFRIVVPIHALMAPRIDFRPDMRVPSLHQSIHRETTIFAMLSDFAAGFGWSPTAAIAPLSSS